MTMIAVAQLGARMHYAVPRILLENGLLDVCYTDIYSRKGVIALAQRWPFQWPQAIRTLSTRQHPALPGGRVVHFPAFGIAYTTGRDRCRTLDDRFRHYVWGGRHFNKSILKRLDKQPPAALYTFNSAGLELMQYARQRGIRLIHEQTMAPHRIERDLLQTEMDRHPEWVFADGFGSGSMAYAEREEQELTLADVVVCGSTFVHDSLNRLGLATRSVRVIPYGVERPGLPVVPKRKRRSGEPLRVLTVGEVGLRKGSPYVGMAAQQLGGRVQVRQMGSDSHVPAQALASLGRYVERVGHVRRDQMAEHYHWADVLLLPSVCEGSATVTYEAMQYGLPLIVTPNVGSLIRDGRAGYVVPAGDVNAIVTCLERLWFDESLRAELGHQARQLAIEAGYEAYAHRLVALLTYTL